MHPAISIVNALVLIVMLASGLPLALSLAAGIILPLLLYSYVIRAFPDLRAVFRLRWLFLSILVLYLLFPPLVGGWQTELIAGLLEAGKRILALILIVILVQLMFTLSSRQQILAGLLWLLRPLKVVGVPVERFALRLMLVLEITPRVQRQLAAETENAALPDTKIARLRQLAGRLTAAYARVVEEAERSPLTPVAVPVLAAPAVWQWLLPCLLFGLFGGIVKAV